MAASTKRLWNTPFRSECVLPRIRYARGLEFLVQSGLRKVVPELFQVVSGDVCAARWMDEGLASFLPDYAYRTSSADLAPDGQALGVAAELNGSDWLCATGSLLPGRLQGGLRHFAILGEDRIAEFISASEPSIGSVSVGATHPLPSKDDLGVGDSLIEEVLDEGILLIGIAVRDSGDRERYNITVQGVVAVSVCIAEMAFTYHLTPDEDWESPLGHRMRRIKDSAWIAEIRDRCDAIDSWFGELMHFSLESKDLRVEFLCTFDPQVTLKDNCTEPSGPPPG